MSEKLTYNEKKLLQAAKEGNIVSAKEALTGDDKHPAADVNYYTDPFGQTALLFAVKHKQLEMVKFLFQQGADLEQSDSCNVTPLICAAEGKWLAGVQYLLEKGAQVNQKSGNFRSAVSVAASHLDLPMLQLLEQYGADFQSSHKGRGWSALFNAVFYYHPESDWPKQLETAKYLVERGGKINEKCYDMFYNVNTPLKAATICGHTELVRYLLERGARINTRDKHEFGDTVLMYASKSVTARPEMIRFLLDNGAEKMINCVNKNGQTAIIMAAERGNYVVVKCLAENGARLGVRDKYGMTVYDYLKDKNPQLAKNLKFLRKNKLKNDLKNILTTKTPAEWVDMSERDATFVKQLVAVGLFMETIKKMTYSQLRFFYVAGRSKLSGRCRERIENIIRNRRQNDSM